MLDRKNKVLTAISLIILALLLIPLILVIITSFNTESSISLPIKGFTFNWYANIFQQPDFISGFESSLIVALLASSLALLIGIPAVYALTRFHIQHAAWFQSFFLSPTLIPEIVIGFALYQAVVVKNPSLYRSSYRSFLIMFTLRNSPSDSQHVING